jgi:hypothetical protein
LYHPDRAPRSCQSSRTLGKLLLARDQAHCQVAKRDQARAMSTTVTVAEMRVSPTPASGKQSQAKRGGFFVRSRQVQFPAGFREK